MSEFCCKQMGMYLRKSGLLHVPFFFFFMQICSFPVTDHTCFPCNNHLVLMLGMQPPFSQLAQSLPVRSALVKQWHAELICLEESRYTLNFAQPDFCTNKLFCISQPSLGRKRSTLCQCLRGFWEMALIICLDLWSALK